MRNGIPPKTLLRFLLLLGMFLFAPAIPFAEGEDFERDVDIEREGAEGDMDRDSIHYEGILHEEIRQDMEEDREERNERDQDENIRDRMDEGNHGIDREEFHDTGNTREELRDDLGSGSDGTGHDSPAEENDGNPDGEN